MFMTFVSLLSIHASYLLLKKKEIETQYPLQLLTYLLHGAESFLRSKTGFAASQEIPRIYGTRKFITVLTSVRHLSLS
jgi:hypothetical protein